MVSWFIWYCLTRVMEPDWDALTGYTVSQMKLRIHLRNAQFSRPVSDSRLAELLRGNAPPVRFDLERVAHLLDK